ncbi:unnamed protein product [Rhizopus stolonifer]
MSNEPHQWLPMPSGISLDQHSFTLDILEQFNCEEAVSDRPNEQQESTESITQPNNNNTAEASNESMNIPHKIEDKRRRSAGDLIRKSSAYLKNKKWNEPLTWTLKRKKNSPPPVQDIFPNAPTKKLSKVAINATISMAPSHSNQSTDIMEGIQPLVITHYPPKPLKYSPVEPLPDTSPEYTEKKSKTLHRLSIPILRMTAALHQHENDNNMRRRSDSDIVYNAEENSSFLSKKWNKLVSTWKKTLKKRRNEPTIHL